MQKTKLQSLKQTQFDLFYKIDFSNKQNRDSIAPVVVGANALRTNFVFSPASSDMNPSVCVGCRFKFRSTRTFKLTPSEPTTE